MLRSCITFVIAGALLTPADGWSQTIRVGEGRGELPLCVPLDDELQAILAHPGLEEAKVGLYIRRMDTGEELFAHNADDRLVPASNVKIVSTAAALHTLGPNYRFRTEVFGDLDDDGVVRGMYVRGNGDPYLMPERIWYLANRLFYLGVRKVRGDIRIDDSYFGAPRLANGWEQDRSSYAYMAPAGAVSVGFNAMLVHIYPGPQPDTPAEVLVEPKSDYPILEVEVNTVRKGRTRLLMDVSPEKDRSKVTLEGEVYYRDPGRGYWRRVDNPPIFAGEVFKAAMRQVGIGVWGKIRKGLVPEKADKLAQLTSPRLAELVVRVNKSSNNFMAEQVARAAGAHYTGKPGTWDAAEMAISGFLVDEVGLKPGSFKIKNASGLHDVNEFTTRQFVDILEYMHNRAELRPEFVASLAVASTSGTLAGRMHDTEASGLLRAKTGTLSIASALSGYVNTAGGEPVAFSIIVNHYKQGIQGVLEVQDQIGPLLASLNFRCTPRPKPALTVGPSELE